jgi:hypothetical protein
MDELSFSQRYGFSPLPRQLRPDELPAELRARIWAVIHSFMESGKEAGATAWIIGGEPAAFLKLWWVMGLHKPIDEFNHIFSAQVKETKAVLYDQKIYKVLDFLEFVLSSQDFDQNMKGIIEDSFVDCRAAWRVVDGQFVPVGTEEEANSISQSLQKVAEGGPSGAKSHFKRSAQLLSDGKWSDSVRESIHAVESTARSLGGGTTLAEALKSIQRDGGSIHPALLKGFLAIYGYTSDEEGVRHAMLDGGDRVGEKEAVFMFGACANFAQYLINLAA